MDKSPSFASLKLLGPQVFSTASTRSFLFVVLLRGYCVLRCEYTNMYFMEGGLFSTFDGSDFIAP